MSSAVSVVIPVWNLWEMTHNCLQSLAQHSVGEAIEVIVVDNGSTDATAVELPAAGRALFGGRFRMVRFEENRGFACACNAGAQAAAGRYLFFLNNDTILTPHWLPPLLRALAPSHVGMAGSLLLYPNNQRVQHCGICFSPGMEASHLYRLLPADCALVCKPRTLQAITGAALLLEAALFAACGGFCEGYRNGFEDMDLCCAVARKKLRIVLAPDSVIYHLTSQTPGRFDHDSDNARLLFERTAGFFAPDEHKIAAEDGLHSFLSPSLEYYIGLEPAQEQALTTAFGQHFQEDRCRSRLTTFPFWQGGYTLLARHLAETGRVGEACDLLTVQTQLFPLPEPALALARLAARVGNAALAEQAVAAADSVRATPHNLPGLCKKANALSQWGRDVGDALVARLYADWLARYGNTQA